MRVYLERLGDVPHWQDQHLRMVELAATDTVGRHIVTDDPATADLWLTVCNGNASFESLTFEPRRRVYCTWDHGFPLLPGLYPSVPRRSFNARYVRSAPYLVKGPSRAPEAPEGSPRYLFTFMGSSLTSPIRRKLLALEHPRALLVDTARHAGYDSNQTAEVYREFEASYHNCLAQSQFVLCPRGIGASSIRLFETMRAGRVPVVISDEWVPPDGPNWNDFSLRIPESQLASIPDRLSQLETQAAEMGRCAFQAWNQYFSEARLFDWMAEQAAAIQTGAVMEFRLWRAITLCHPRNIRPVLAPLLKQSTLKFLGRLKAKT